MKSLHERVSSAWPRLREATPVNAPARHAGGGKSEAADVGQRRPVPPRVRPSDSRRRNVRPPAHNAGRRRPHNGPLAAHRRRRVPLDFGRHPRRTTGHRVLSDAAAARPANARDFLGVGLCLRQALRTARLYGRRLLQLRRLRPTAAPAFAAGRTTTAAGFGRALATAAHARKRRQHRSRHVAQHRRGRHQGGPRDRRQSKTVHSPVSIPDRRPRTTPTAAGPRDGNDLAQSRPPATP